MDNDNYNTFGHVTAALFSETDLKSKKRVISLLNFDPNSKRRSFLTRYSINWITENIYQWISPRSIEACKSQGVEEWELLIKSKAEFEKEHVPDQFKEDANEYLDIKTQFYEKSRLTTIEKLLEVIILILSS